jgi:hypothetical protein
VDIADRVWRCERYMSDQAHKAKHEAVPQWAEGLYYNNKGLFSEAMVYHTDNAIPFEVRG